MVAYQSIPTSSTYMLELRWRGEARFRSLAIRRSTALNTRLRGILGKAMDASRHSAIIVNNEESNMLRNSDISNRLIRRKRVAPTRSYATRTILTLKVVQSVVQKLVSYPMAAVSPHPKSRPAAQAPTRPTLCPTGRLTPTKPRRSLPVLPLPSQLYFSAPVNRSTTP